MAYKETKVLVRCALQCSEDKIVICPDDWTVYRLKEHISHVWPENPV